MNTRVAQDPTALRLAWSKLRETDPKIRTRNAAVELRVSEAELVATRCGGDGVRRIAADVAMLLPRLEALGELIALTRNDVFVHEKVGVYQNVSIGKHASQVVGDDIDLRVFPSAWQHGFAVEPEGPRGATGSLQFFDQYGTAVHKIFLREDSACDAYEALVADLLVDDQSPAQHVESQSAPTVPRPDNDIDVGALQRDWRGMRDTHDFFQILRTHDVDRRQALRVVSNELAHRVVDESLRTVLTAASGQEIDVMIFVRSPGTFQIHHGPVKRIVDTGPWLNVLDPGFNLHVLEDGIMESWFVRKPTETGWVTSLELYDAQGELNALLFGCRKEGQPEDERWKRLLQGLTKIPE